jgi:hypothetical protein
MNLKTQYFLAYYEGKANKIVTNNTTFFGEPHQRSDESKMAAQCEKHVVLNWQVRLKFG